MLQVIIQIIRLILKIFGIIPKFKYVSMTCFKNALTYYKMFIYNTLFSIMSSLFSGFYLGGGGGFVVILFSFWFCLLFSPSPLRTDASTFRWDFQAL